MERFPASNVRTGETSPCWVAFSTQVARDIPVGAVRQWLMGDGGKPRRRGRHFDPGVNRIVGNVPARQKSTQSLWNGKGDAHQRKSKTVKAHLCRDHVTPAHDAPLAPRDRRHECGGGRKPMSDWRPSAPIRPIAHVPMSVSTACRSREEHPLGMSQSRTKHFGI